MAVPLSNLSATWSTSETAVNTAIKMNAVDNLSNTNSKLLDLQTNSESQFVVYKDGRISAGIPPTINPAAIIEAWSKDKGILFPRMSTTERNSITNPPDGLVIYNETSNFLQIRRNGIWTNVGDVGVAGELPEIAKTLYVSTSGDDALNDGTNEFSPYATIEKAVEIAIARDELTVIKVGPGVYYTNGHIDLPDNCVVQATHRGTYIRPNPGYEERNVFRMGSGCFVEGFMIENFRLDSLTNPTEGFAFSFRPGAVIIRVPYAHKCAVRSAQPDGFTGATLDAVNGNPQYPRGAGVCLADGLVCSQYSIFPNIMTWGATPVSYNGIGYCAKNGGLINAVNAISMWSHKHFLAINGGQIILSACATQFGDYSLVADGSRQIIVPNVVNISVTANSSGANLVSTNRTTIVDGLWANLVSQGYTTGWNSDDETYTRYDSDVWLRSVEYMIRGGGTDMIERFQTVLYDTVGDPVFSPDKKVAFIHSYNYMKDELNKLTININARESINAATTAVQTTIDVPVKRIEPSRIEAIGHTWTATMIGVWTIKIPPAEARLPIRDSILELNGGVVIATGQDSAGNALFAGDVTIDARFGMGGRGFISPTKREATRAAITFGAF